MNHMIARAKQVFNKLFFCLRVSAGTRTLLRLMIESKRLNRYQKNKDPGKYDGTAKALSYAIRFHSLKRIIHLRTHAGDIRMFYEIFWEKVYWLPPALVGEPLVIVDAGANIGMAALYFLMSYPRARVYCIEPDPDNFSLLRENLAAEGERVVLIEAALNDRDGRVGLLRDGWAYNSRIAGGTGTVGEKWVNGEREELRQVEGMEGGDRMVRALSPDRLLEEWRLERIDLLKMDIEGAEHQLFGSGTAFGSGMAWLAKVHTLLIEVHAPGDIGAIRDRLIERGFGWRHWDRPGAGASLFLASRTEKPRLADP